MMKNRVAAVALRALLPAVKVLAKVFPSQSNCFAFAVSKVKELHPWMKSETEVNEKWVRERYTVWKS
jgi:hypothetical protein